MISTWYRKNEIPTSVLQLRAIAKENLLKELEDNTARKMVEVERLRAELEARNQRLIELEQILYSKEAQMLALKDAISKALYGFEQEGLSAPCDADILSLIDKAKGSGRKIIGRLAIVIYLAHKINASD